MARYDFQVTTNWGGTLASTNGNCKTECDRGVGQITAYSSALILRRVRAVACTRLEGWWRPHGGGLVLRDAHLAFGEVGSSA